MPVVQSVAFSIESRHFVCIIRAPTRAPFIFCYKYLIPSWDLFIRVLMTPSQVANCMHASVPAVYMYIFFCGAATQRGSWPPHSWGFYITHNDAPQSVGLLWTSDQLVAKTSTWHHTTLTTDRHPCPRWDSNPRSQQANGRRPTS